MARIKKFGDTSLRNLSNFATFITDTNPNSDYFRVTEFKETLTGGKNGFLIEGSEYLMESTEIKIEVLDVNGDPMYYEPGDGIPEYYEGVSKIVAVYVYEDTPIGQAKITILGELKTYIDTDGVVRDIPEEWKGIYNVKWEKTFKVNKLLSNEDKVRFYKRPTVTIDEISRPIFSATPTLIQQSGSVNGTPQVPVEGTPLAGFSLPTSYLLTITDSTNWTGSVLNGTISLPNLGITMLPSDVVTNKQLTVSTPYTINGNVVSFTNQPYTASFNYLDTTNLGTALSGSFAKINLKNLTTFVGDVARVKVFRKSQSEVSDFQFIQEIALESNEVLIDLESSQRNQENYGLFTPYILDTYWNSSSLNLTSTFNQNFLFNSVNIDSTGTNYFYTSKSIDINEGVEYTLDLNLRLLENLSSENYIRVFVSGSKNNIQLEQDIIKLDSSNPYLQKTNINENFIAQAFDNNVKLYFEVKGNGWYLSDISLRASQETSFSPDEITFIQSIPRNLTSETFDFRFEFYDINNNYIPVLVEATKTFDKGNLNAINKNISLVPTSLYFQFDSGSATGNPLPPTAIFFDVVKEFLTGSTNFTSRSFDIDNNELSSSQYSGGQFPGLLIDEGGDLFRLTVENFTGSVGIGNPDKIVQYIEYTAECEGVSDSVVITRVSDGKGGVNHFIRPYRGTSIRNSSTQSLEIQAVRVDGVNEINLYSGAQNNWGDIQLHVLSASLNPISEPEKFINLELASNTDFVKGLDVGSLGSGEINYNAIFNRDSIDSRRIVYLMPSSSAASGPAFQVSASVLASIVLEDIQDGLDAGIVLYDADSFSVDPSPKLSTDVNRFIPTFSSATASFYKRGTTVEPISCSIEVYPSMSLNNDFVAEYWVNYITHSCDPNISIVAFDEFGNVIPSRLDAANYLGGVSNNQNKQLITSFTYTEEWTSASVSVDKLFSIVPDGLVGDEPISFVINPTNVVIKANENGDPLDLTPSATSVKVKQGNRFLVYDTSGVTGNKSKHGTYYLAVNGDGIVTPGSFAVNPSDSTEVLVQPITSFTNTNGTVEYEISYQPFYTSSTSTEFVTQSFTKVSDGRAARSVSLVSTTNTVTYDGDGVIISPEGDIVLSAQAFNTTGSAYFQFFKDGVQLNAPTSINFGGDTYVLSSGDVPAADEVAVYRVTLRDGSGDENDLIFAEDTVTISATKSGTKAYNVQLTNENSSVFIDVYDTPVFTGTGTTIVATKGGTPLTAVTSFASPTFDSLGTPIPNGQYKVTIDSKSAHITLAGGLTAGGTVPVVGGQAVIGDITAWADFRDPLTLQPDLSTAEIVYRIDLEDGVGPTIYKTQSLSVQYEGAIGPGVVVRGEWTGSIDYIYDVPAKRRDAVIRVISGDTHYWATTATLVKSLTPPYTQQPVYNIGSPPSEGDIDAGGWQYLGMEDFFVAAKIAIFEESFVKNVINVGNNGGNESFANIVINGGRIDPYIAVGQTGTSGASGDQDSPGVIGYNNPGIFLGTKVISSNKRPMMSLVNSGATKYLRWNGDTGTLDIKGDIIADNGTFNGTINAAAGNFTGFMTVAGGTMKFGQNAGGSGTNGLFITADNYWYSTGAWKVGSSTNYVEWNPTVPELKIVGALTQTTGGTIIGRVLGPWSNSFSYIENDIVSHLGRSWYCKVAHNSATETDDEPMVGSNYTYYWGIAADAGTSGTAGSSGANGANGADGSSGTSGVDGPQGNPGPGITYVGECSLLASGFTWVSDSTTRMVTMVAGTYYLTKAAANGVTKGTTGCPPNATYFETMANFASVATDILLAKDANIYRGLVIGSLNGSNGFVRSSSATSLTGGKGFYLQQDGQFRFGNGTSAALPYVYWDNSSLTIKGVVFLDEGSKIGNWTVKGNNFQDNATDANVKLRLNPTVPALEIYDGGEKLIDIRPGALTSVGSANVTWNGPSVSGRTGTYDSSNYTPGKSYSSGVSLGTISSTGVYEVTGVSNLWGTSGIDITIGMEDDPPLSFVGLITATVYFELHNVSSSPSPSSLLWQSNAISVTSFATGDSVKSPVLSDASLSVTLTAGTTYYLYTVIEYSGGISAGQVDLSGLADPVSRTANLVATITEITSDGIFSATSANRYFRVNRSATGSPLTEIYNDQASPTLKLTNSSGAALETGNVSVTGSNNIEIASGYVGTNSSTFAVRIGQASSAGRIMVQGFTAANTSGTNNIRLRTRATAIFGLFDELYEETSTIANKLEIEDYPDSAYDSIKKLKPILFTPRNTGKNYWEPGSDFDYNEEFPQMENPKEYVGKMGGFIAEWVDEIPELRKYVAYAPSGSISRPKGIAYDKLIVPLTRAVQILMEKVESLEAQISGSILK